MMADKTYSLIKEVSESAQNWRIKARVARLWEHRDEKKNNELIRLHLVLVDEKGDGIHAFVPQGQIPRFKPLLAEGHVFYLHYFEVSPAVRPYRSTVHSCELRFVSWTTLKEVADPDGAILMHYYTLRSFKELFDNITDKTYLADVLGLVSGISPITSVNTRNGATLRRNLRVTDGRYTTVVTLWGDKAQDVDADSLIQRSLHEPVVLLAMGCGFKIQDGLLQLSPSYGSKICYDVVNSDVSAFRNRYTTVVTLWGDKAQDVDADSLIQRSLHEPVVLLAMGCGFKIQDGLLQLSPSYGSKICYDVVNSDVSAFRNRIIGIDYAIEFIPDKGRQLGFSEIENVSVSYLAGLIPHDHLTKVYRTKIMIHEVPSAQNWWFRSCDRCGSGATEYKLGIIAAGDGDVVDMVFFGDIATDLIGKPADKLIAEFLDRNSLMPPDINRLVGRRYVVEVTVSRFSLRRERIDFQVLKFYPEGGAAYASFLFPNAPSGDGGSTRAIADDPLVRAKATDAELVETLTSAAVPATAKDCDSTGEKADVHASVQGEAVGLAVLCMPPQSVLDTFEEDAE